MQVAREGGRGRDYVTLMRCPSTEGWLPTAATLITTWLQEKSIEADLDTSADHEHARGTLLVRRVTTSNSDNLRISMVESDDRTGIWTTELLAHDEPGVDGWISLEVTNSRGQFVNVPRIARSLMAELPLADASLEFTAQHRLFGVDDVERLIEVLADDQRHGLVFVAGSRTLVGAPIEAYTRQVDQWAREVYGLAQVIVLDPDASVEFADRVGERFAAPSLAIRSYQPGVRFGDISDERRHRILGTTRLANQSERSIRLLLGDIARQQSATRPSDPAVQRIRRAFDRLEDRRLVAETVVPEPVLVIPEPADPPPQVTIPVEDPLRGSVLDSVKAIALVRRVLGLAQITEQSLRDFIARLTRQETQRQTAEALRQRFDALQSAKEELEDQNRELAAALDDAQLEGEVARLDVDNRDGRIRWLETRLTEKGDYEAAWASTPSDFTKSRPNNFGELLYQITQLDGVQFTGDTSEVEKLNQIDTNDTALRAAWDAVLVMTDYVRARREGAWEHGLDLYIQNPPSGFRTIPSRKFAESESSATMQAYGAERIFSVPMVVAASGRVTMKPHFKLARIGRVSPRMHVYDGHPASSCVYIGYIGPHLRIAQSS